MKVSPLAAGTGVPSQLTPSGQTATPDRLERAKAIASGQEPVVAEEPQSSGDPQVDKLRKIKMRTQQSTNRHEMAPEPIAEPVIEQNATPDPIEQASVTEETRPLSPQFAALAKAKRALQVKEREIFQREEALKAQNPEGNVDFKAQLKANPLSVLQEAGVTYDQLTEAILANQNAPIDPQKLRAEIKEDLKKELLGEFSTRDQQAEQQVLSELKREALEVTKDGEQYEAIREARAQQDVVNLIHTIWQKGWPEKGYPQGYIMDVESAAELVENQLIDESVPFARLKKVQSRLTPAQVEKLEQIPSPTKSNTKVMRTLTNRDSASPIMDRRQRAIMAMQGTLKKG